MAHGHYSLAVASDAEISAVGVRTMTEAVTRYSVSAGLGFSDCRFVAFGLQDIVVGVQPEDYVLSLTGDDILRVNICKFGDRPCNLRGWLVLSNSNYTLNEFYLIFGGCGGTVVPVDNYMCGADGRPAVGEDRWTGDDMFGDNTELVINDTTFVKAWTVVRTAVPHAKTNVTGIESIKYNLAIPHRLRDGCVVTLPKPVKRSAKLVLDSKFNDLLINFGVGFVQSGETLSAVVSRPVFMHALVACPCGASGWTVGDWTGFVSTCCGLRSNVITSACGFVVPGDAVIATANAGTGTKYYNGMTLKYVCTMEGVSIWRVIKLQAVKGFVAASTYSEEEHERPLDTYSFDKSSSNLTKIKFCILGYKPDAEVLETLTQGFFELSNKVVDVTTEIFKLIPWFIRKCECFMGAAWDAMKQALLALSYTNVALLKFVKSLAAAAVKVVNGTVSIIVDVPEKFADAFNVFKNALEVVVSANTECVKVGDLCVRQFGKFLFFDNAIAQQVTAKVRGVRQAGVKSGTYFNAVIGATREVEVRRLEISDASLLAVDVVPFSNQGYAVLIGGYYFFRTGIYYQMMSDESHVLLEPAFVAADPVRVECPKALSFLDGGAIWEGVKNTCTDLVAFVKSLDIKITVEGVVGSCVKRFKKFLKVLLELYNTFFQSVKSVITVAGLYFCKLDLKAPVLWLKDRWVSVEEFKPEAGIPVEVELNVVKVFGGYDSVGVTVTRVESAVLELQDTEYEDPELEGVVVVADDYAFYKSGDRYYPYTCDGAAKVCYKQGGGKVTFAEEVQEVEIDRVRIIKLKFEFESEDIVNVLERIIGKSLSHSGDDWDVFEDALRGAVGLVAEQMTMPPFYIYDDQGGKDLDNVVMVSQWPIEEEEKKDETPDVIVEQIDDNVEIVEEEFIPTSDEQDKVAQEFGIVVTPPAVTVSPFAYDYNELNGIKVLVQDSNNCWVNAVCYQLQMLGLFDDHDAFKLFRAGRVEHFVQKCYEAIGAFKGSMGDAGQCLEKLLTGLKTLRVTCDVACICGVRVEFIEGCVFRFLPTGRSFPYGICLVCNGVLNYTIKSIDGTGIFVQDPAPFNHSDSLVPIVCESIYIGAAACGHYLVNDHVHKLCVDGNGVDALRCGASVNTICVKNVKMATLKPFTTHANIKFYRAEFKDLLGLDFDFVVNAANEQLKHAGGVAKAINDATGGELQLMSDSYIAQHKKVWTGSGCMLECSLFKVLNVVGPKKGGRKQDTLLKSAYECIFKQPGVPLTPLISVGIFGIPINASLAQLVSVAGDKSCHCFVYSAKEEEAVLAALVGLANAPKPQPKKEVTNVDVVGVKAETPKKDVKSSPKAGPESPKKRTKPLPKVDGDTPKKDVKPSPKVEPEPSKPVVEQKTAKTAEVKKVVPEAEQTKATVEAPAADQQVEILEPILTVGELKFYDNFASVQNMYCNFVVYVSSDLTLDAFGKVIDTAVEGLLSRAIADFKTGTPVVPPGNVLQLQLREGFNVCCAVMPDLDDSKYSINLKRTLRKLSKLEGALSGVCSALFHVVNYVTDFCICTPECRVVVDEFMSPRVIMVKVQDVNGREVIDVPLAANQTIGDQLDTAVVESNADVTHVVPSGADVVVAPSIDWGSYFGFAGADTFYVMDHSGYAFESVYSEDLRLLTSTDNNCWVNSCCILLQRARVQFVCLGLDSMWNKFIGGDVGPFVHWLYYVLGKTKGDKGDVEHALLAIRKHLKNNATLVIGQSSVCTACDFSDKYVECAVHAAPINKDGAIVRKCQHGFEVCERILQADGLPIVVDLKPTALNSTTAVKSSTYNLYSGFTSAGHYTVWSRGVVIDGTKCARSSFEDATVTACVCERMLVSCTKEFKSVVVSLNEKAEQFFSFGDYVRVNIVAILVWFFSIFQLCFRAFKFRDLKVLGGVPQRTGMILQRSLKYNMQGAINGLKGRWWFVKTLIKLKIVLFTLYALMVLLLAYTPISHTVCTGYEADYANSTFNKREVCGNDLLCRVCLDGHHELSDFAHLTVQWTYRLQTLDVALWQLAYFIIMALVGGFYTRIILVYFVVQYISVIGVYYGFLQHFWILHLISFDVFGTEIVTVVLVVKLLLFFKHVVWGCDSTSCVACCKSAKLKRVPMSTIVNGTAKNFYVNANGGKKFCKKHNFFCINCDSYGPGNTFINAEIARELSNVVKTSVTPTDVAYVEIDKVEFEDGFYRLFSGDKFWKYNFDITQQKYSCKEVLKSLNLLDDFIIYNDGGVNVTNVRNAAVYFSQVLCKPIKLVNATLLASLNVDFNGALHSAFVNVLTASYGADLSTCSNMSECRKEIGVVCSEDEFVKGVSHAHKHDVLLTDMAYNNLCTTYAKPEEKLSHTDIATCLRVGAKVCNHNVMIKEQVPCVWNVRDFSMLSDEARKYVVKTAKAKGVTFLLTYNTNAMKLEIPATAITAKAGAGVSDAWRAFCFVMRYLWYFCACVLLVFMCRGFFSTPTYATSIEGFDFKLIKDGKLVDFVTPEPCVYNVFSNFEEWYIGHFGETYTTGKHCPIVVGVLESSSTVPGVPSNVELLGRQLMFYIQTAFSSSANCYAIDGVAEAAACVFNSACTVLEGLGGKHTYCYKSGILDAARLYSDLVPHAYYKYDGDKFIRLPEILFKGFGMRAIKTEEMQYCRVGECIDSQRGVCVGLDSWFVFDRPVGSSYMCGIGLFNFLYNLWSVFNSSWSVVALSGQMTFNLCVACVAIFACFMFIKFKRLFGDLSFAVFVIITAMLVNNFSYIITQNFLGMVGYAVVYFALTRNWYYSWVWQIFYVVAYAFIAPWWVLLAFIIAALIGVVPTFLKLKISTQLFDGDKFVGTFEGAAVGTFVLDIRSYERLVNSVSADKLRRHAADYNKYKYYSGSANEADYRSACYAHLAKAMMDFGKDHSDKLYTPPSVSFNSTLQSGLRKMAQPCGIIEPCIVRVCYGNVSLNGVWLGDQVYCPRHVIALDTTKAIDYEYAYSMMRLCNFTITKGNVTLGVISAHMRGVNLVIKVNQNNVTTPSHVFRTLRAGENFNILACYDGVPSGVFGVNMRHNNTIRGSFINGACGSPGYVVSNGVVEFVYIHHLELGTGVHVGSNFDGFMYGNYDDQPSMQLEGVNQNVTENVCAFLYAALLNGDNWWLQPSSSSIDAYNEWARSNGFTSVTCLNAFNILAAKTGVDTGFILSAIQRLATGFGGKTILSYASLTDEFTLGEVVKQIYGVNLQCSKTVSALKGVIVMCLLQVLFWVEFFTYTPFMWISPSLVLPLVFGVAVTGSFLTTLVKHKAVFAHVFLLPAILIVCSCNVAFDYYYVTYVAGFLDQTVSILGIDVQSLVTVVMCCMSIIVFMWRFATERCDGTTVAIAISTTVLTWFYNRDPVVAGIMFLCAFMREWYVGLMCYKISMFATHYFMPSVIFVIGEPKFVAFLYVSCGFAFCMYWGLLYWINSIFKSSWGIYDFVVSPAEFKYMVANGLNAPHSVWDSIFLSLRLMGIGGNRTIRIARVQSKLTDIKCANVVLLGCLSSMNIAANSKEWAYCVDLHNKINLADDATTAQEMLCALVAFFLSKNKDFGVDDLLNSYFDNNALLQSVASAFAQMPSYIAYETARANFEDACNSGANPQLIKQLKKAMNIAKSEFDKESAVQRKIERMAENAAAQMYKEARIVNRKSKVISSMHAMLFSMLRRLDMSNVDHIMQLARNGVVPLSIIPAAAATRLMVIVPDLESYVRLISENVVHYAGAVWNVCDIKDNDSRAVHANEIRADNVEGICWPLTITCERAVKLQNNEIMPGKMKQLVMKAEGDNGLVAEGKALYQNETGKTFIYAFVADKPDLKVLKYEHEGGCIAVELEPPCRFAVETANGTAIKYLYFVKNLNTLRRGAVLGFIGSTIRLQAGRQTEVATNSSLLTVCAFAVDPAAAYVDAVKSGIKPIGNCVKMLANGSGNGQAITNGVEANTAQDSYGGASVCLYCRCHIDHPGMDGRCKFKGKYVQVPMSVTDPIRFCLENDVCRVCMCWLNHGCQCDRAAMQSIGQDQAYLNRVRGSSAARLEPLNGSDVDVVVRAFDIYNARVACIAKYPKTNCVRMHNLDERDAFWVIKKCTKSCMDLEQDMYNKLKCSKAVAQHEFFEWRDGRSIYGNVVRRNLTKYTMMDLCYALRNFDEKDCDILRDILVLTGACEESYFDNPKWYDPVENEDIHMVYAKLGRIVATAMLKCVAMCDTMIEQGVVGVLTLDNQDLNGDFYDFGDFIQTLPGMGVPLVTSYYSYMMPVMGMTNCLAHECFQKSDIFGSDFKTFDLLTYDFTEHKEKLFNKYFKYWGQDYHPNCVDCYDEMCIVHCANFNTLFATTIPPTAFGPLCRKVFVDGVPLVATAGYHFKQLGIVWNQDVNVHSTRLSINELLQFVADPALLIASSPALVDKRTVCFSVAALSTGMTKQTVKPGHFNQEFYEFLKGKGFFNEGSSLTLKHFFFAQKDDAAIKDFDFYRYNRTTMLDICQARVAYKVVTHYFDCYEGGCISAKDVVVTNLNKSAGYPLNKLGKAGLYYESLSYDEQDHLYALTKRNILPTMTQLNLKYAISGKERARTVGGVSLLSTMTTRQFHQKHLKSIVNTRNATVVIGTTKFYGGWDNMLNTLISGVENPCLMGWDYPKCDRALPSMIRMISAMILGSKHVTCCTASDKYYRLCNELAQVLTEVVYSNGGFYFKPGGTTSGDATTAYANSVFNIFQAVSANINRLLTVDSYAIHNESVKSLQRQLYDNCYRATSVDATFVSDYYQFLRKHFSMMILSDDGVVCYNKDYADMGYVADIGAFKAALYYQNNVFMSTAKCWVETDLSKGPHEFCSQHTLQIVDQDGKYYLPYPDPSRIISAGVFVDDVAKTDSVVLLERYVSLAIDAYPLSKHPDPEYQKVFYTMLEWVKHLTKTLHQGILETFSVTLLEDASSKFWTESFYAGLYEKSTLLQSAGLCVVCSSQTVLRCGDCLRRPLLCTKCAYDHVVSTDHKFILSITPYVCNASGCSVNDVTQLFLGGLSYYCKDHKPQLSFPLCSNGNVFGLYKASATGSEDVDVFNKLAVSDWSDVEDYKTANKAKESLRLFAAETIKAKEECVKSSYACATLREIVSPKEIILGWEAGKVKPPLNRNSVFTGYQINKDSRFQVGEFIFEKLEYGSDTVTFKTTATTKLVPGMVFVLTSHNVQPLTAPTIINQERYSTIYKLHPSFNISDSYSNLVSYYQMIGKQRVTTIQGPPGSGKSHCVIGLGLYYPGARIVFTACSHAAVDSLCHKAATAYSTDKCSRIIPARARVDCYQGFKSNNTSAQYIFSTVNALPEANVDIVVVDEVSMCTNYELSLINARILYKHIVYVGDPQQLPAPRTLITRGVLRPADYNVVTQRMCGVGPDIFLHRCYRCPAEIVRTVSKMVYEDKFLPVHPDSKQCFKMFCRGNVQVDNGSSVNRRQLEVIKMFLSKNKSWSKAVFISPYNSQNYMAARFLGIQTQTVDSSQGSEYDYVVYAQTSDTAHACNVNRFNVAITRAKKGIFCVMSDRSLFDLLQFFEVKTTDLQADVVCGLFKDCYRYEEPLPPSHAVSTIALSDKYKVSADLAVQLGVNPDNCKYEHVMSFMGFRFDISIPGYHNLFCTRDYAIRNVRGWIGFDVEGAHVCGANLGTNVPLQLGFSNGVDFVVQPEGCVMTESGSTIQPIKARAPPGEQFAHLIPLMRRGQPWTVVRKRIVSMLADALNGVSDELIFVLWAGGLELTTMRYFVKVGVEKVCHCGKMARCYSSAQHQFYCFNHYQDCDYLYNPHVIDIQQWGYQGSLSVNHHMHCNVHRNAHVASGDAIMTRCLAVYECFVKHVDWTVTYPFIANEAAVNKSGRVVQRHVMHAAIQLYKPKAIHDVGNPKGVRCAVTEVPWYCYDKDPVNTNVKALEYDYMTHGQLDGLCLFWNCNVDMYPGFAVVCRFDTRVKSKLNLDGVNGGSLYVNNHAFHTPAYDRRAFANLKPAPFFYFDDGDCDKIQGEINYVPLRSSSCVTKCNIGGAVCSKHANLYRNYVELYNTFTHAGFNIWVPTSFDVYNLWQLVMKSNLQGLENIAYNVVKKGHFEGVSGESPVAIIGDRVMVRDGVTDKHVFTNKTSLPTNVAFELYAKRKVGLTPPLTVLRNLGGTCTYKHVLWDYDANVPFTQYTKDVCAYTDFAPDVCTVFDNSINGSFEKFTLCDNAILYSLTAIKNLTAIKLNFGYLNGLAVSDTTIVSGAVVSKKPVCWYIYSRKNGMFVDYYDGLYSQGRTTTTFQPRSVMEEDFLNMDIGVFVTKYGLEDFNFEHVVFGDVSKTTLGGLHLLISQVRLSKLGILKAEEFLTGDDTTLKSCTITYVNDPSSKMVCTYMDLLLDDFVTILKSLDLSVVSKVHEVIIDCKPFRWMLWCKDAHIATFYPQLQSIEWKCGYNMPSVYKCQRMCMDACNLYNYGRAIILPSGISVNVVKYTQLCQYLNTTSLAVPNYMRVLHLGASSGYGTSPGSSVLRRWLPDDAILVDNDVRDYVSDADFSFTGDCTSLYLEDKFDLVVSDMYDGNITGCDGENSSVDGFFTYINGVISEKLALGGTIAIKVTEYSWNVRLYELAQKFDYWTLFCTSVNTSSSEAFLIGVNYLGDFSTSPITSGETIHANYIFWRNSTVMSQSYNSVLDLSKFKLKLKATVVVPLKDSDVNDMVLGLIKKGKLLVRNNFKYVGFSNHLVSTK
ncbi:polyprotein 1ab [Bat alphacoronavirus]|uniref:ORF1ab polyprotein n=1 Tax=bat alphacoronavirus isolate AMA_L_F TaxID=3070181 RepID=A0AA48ZMR4_9ALPC|nr:polyprotein 1ab [Bat alphacoronavirus]QLE11824.1 polyprotein 1ab [bat alphacoronavirus isolate AMA_L_F]